MSKKYPGGLVTLSNPIVANSNAGSLSGMVASNVANFNPAYGAAAPGVWTLDQAEYLTANRLWPIYDPQFNRTTLMLHGNSPTNLPTWITDASTNNFAVTVNGDAKASSQTPFSISSYPTAGSGYFDGSGDFLNRAFTSTTDGMYPQGTTYTIEAWAYITTTSGTQTIYEVDAANVGNYGYVDLCTIAGVPNFIVRPTTGGVQVQISGGTVSANTWFHIAASVSAGSAKLFLNGTQVATGTVSAASFTPTGAAIGSAYNGFVTNYLSGYISNLRITQGVAVYTGNFTTPTAPLALTQSAGTNISAITGTQVSLLTLQNSQPSANSSFTDSSTNNFAITRNGSTTQGTFTPFSQTGWGNYFGTGTDYLTIADNAAFDIGASEFSIETFVYPTASVNSTYIFGQVTYSTAAGSYVLWVNSTGYPTFYSTTGGTTATRNDITSSAILPLNSWSHVCICRSGTTLSLFLNGIRVATQTYSSTIFNATNTLAIGADAAGTAASLFKGYISNLRMLKGTSAYDANQSTLTVPTSILTNVTNTSLLTCQSNRFIDNSTANAGSGFTITPSGSPSVQAFSPFYPKTAYDPLTIGGSGYFNGSTDYLSVPYSANLMFGASSFTIEAWVYPTSTSGSITILSCNASGAGSSTQYQMTLASGVVTCTAYGGGTSYTATAGTAIANAWNYVAFVRNGTTITAYLNGVAGTGTNISTTTLNSGTGFLTFVGAIYTTGTTVGQYFPGYISNIRILNGTAATITVPTAPPTPITNTQLLLNYTNAGIIDNTGKNDLVTVGTAQISTTQSKYGGSSMKFNGTTDYLVSSYGSATSPLEVFNAGDFTVECWVYFSANPTSQNVICSNYQNTTNGWTLSVESSVIKFRCLGDPVVVSSTTTIVASAWYHVAVSRNGSTIRAFLNGTQEGSATNSDNIATTTVQLNIGRLPNNSGFFNGYIDDLRISRYARYTTNFTPPTSQLQDQ